jgi:hypothetical protein
MKLSIEKNILCLGDGQGGWTHPSAGSHQPSPYQPPAPTFQPPPQAYEPPPPAQPSYPSAVQPQGAPAAAPVVLPFAAMSSLTIQSNGYFYLS